MAVNQAYLHKHNEPLFVEKLVIKIILLFNGQYSQQHCLFEIIYDIHSYYDAFRFIYSRKVCTMYHVKGINKPCRNYCAHQLYYTQSLENKTRKY